MGRNCTVCVHPASGNIDAALETGQPLREIAATYNISKTALHRHWHAHVVGESPVVALNTGTSTRAKRGPLTRIIARWGLILGIGLGILSWARKMRTGAGATESADEGAR